MRKNEKQSKKEPDLQRISRWKDAKLWLMTTWIGSKICCCLSTSEDKHRLKDIKTKEEKLEEYLDLEAIIKKQLC